MSGIFTGLLFPLINDFGLYVPVLFGLFAIGNTLIKLQSHLKLNNGIILLKEIGLFLFGYVIGLIPFAIYLLVTGSFSWFLFYLQNLRDIALFAKTPFFHAISSIDNIFTLGLLVVTIFFFIS